jgi:Tfp pilus assembly protein PilO
MRSTITIILFAVSIAVFFFFTMPILDNIKQTNSDIALYNDALGNAKKFIGVRDTLLTKYNQLPAEGLAKLQKLLPDTIDNVRLIIDINGIARRDGLTLSGVQVSGGQTSAAAAAAGGTPYDSVTIGFSTSATFETFQKFISDLEHSLRIMDITNLSFSASEKDMYQFNVQMKTYWLK